MGPEDIIIAIAGNKADLEDRREVSTEMAKKYAQKLEDERGMGQSALFFETSAKEDMNVKAIFEELSTFTRRGVRGEGGSEGLVVVVVGGGEGGGIRGGGLSQCVPQADKDRW
jgi:hypothetical protein